MFLCCFSCLVPYLIHMKEYVYIYYVYTNAYIIGICDKSSKRKAWSIQFDFSKNWHSIHISYSEYFYSIRFKALSCEAVTTHFRTFSSNSCICHQSSFCFSGFVNSGPWIYMVFIQQVVFGVGFFSWHNILKIYPSHSLHYQHIIYFYGFL